MGSFGKLAGMAAMTSLVLACGGPEPAAGVGWRSQMSEIRIVVRGDEADPQQARRWDAYRAYLTEITGLPVRTFEATDYNGSIQALSAGQVDMAQMGGGSYANVDAQVGGLVAPILLSRQAEGNMGYYSAIMVRRESSFQSLEDLRGHTLGYVDFNSTSGYVYPRFTMRQQGIDPETFFADTLMAGGHTQAVMALANGQVDAVVVNVSGGTPATGFTTGPHYTLGRQGLIDPEDFRLVWFAGPMANSPMVTRTDRPQAFIDLVRGAMATMPYEEPQIWADVAQLQGSTFVAVDRRAYEDVIGMREQEIAERRGLAPTGGE